MKKIIVIIGGAREALDEFDFIKQVLGVTLIKASSFSVFSVYISEHHERLGDVSAFIVIGKTGEDRYHANLNAIRVIKNSEEFSPLPILFVGEADPPEFVSHCENLEVRYLPRPIDQGELIAQLQDILAREAPPSFDED
ncbi:MAG TPA: hypothetical protein PKJ16_11580 [Spirochaetota bacterium]|nr:hypothetical protein [Spirochaetota bacterium]HPU88676.1 hypothetical protein [Spirochaetota bacterium]